MEDTPIPTPFRLEEGVFSVSVKRHCPGTGVICQKYQAAVFPEYPQPDGAFTILLTQTGLHRIFQQVAQYHRHLRIRDRTLLRVVRLGFKTDFMPAGLGGIVAD